MTLQLTVSPDFSPDHIAGWYVFNTWLQRKLGVRIHLELYDDFDSQRQAIAANKVDLIYANPYDAAMLVREKGFVAIAACGDDARSGREPDRHDHAGAGRSQA